MSSIIVPEGVLEQAKEHAVREYPHECCGALLGVRAECGTPRVTAILEIPNLSTEDRRRRFSIAPRDYLHAEREAERQGAELLGFYHSHPDHPARPSETDRVYAQTGFSYPILSVAADGVRDINSWRIPDRTAPYEQESLVVVPEEPTPDI